MTEGTPRAPGRRLVLASLGAGLVAAAGQPPPPVVDLTVVVGANVNPGIDGRPLPVAVKPPEMPGRTMFSSRNSPFLTP